MEGWLTELGINYSNIEEDFSNGYLLGSILYRYNLQEDFGTFSTKPSYAAHNLSKLQLSLERIGIKLVPDRIISKEQGYVLKILSLIFKALHNISHQSLKSLRGKSAVSISRPNKFEIIENNLKKFDEIRVQQSEKALNEEKKQLEAIRQGYLGERKKQIDILKSNKLFLQQWDTEGKKNWKKNQMRKTARIAHTANVLNKINNDTIQKKIEYTADHCLQVIDGIKDFERNMIRLGIDHVPDSKDVKKKKIDIKTEAMVTMAKIIDRKNINMQATKEREIRQRNLIVEQKKNEKFDFYKKGSKKIWEVLKNIFTKRYSLGFGILRKYTQKLRTFHNSLKNTEDILKKTELKWGKIENERQQKIEETLKSTLKNLAFEKHRIQSSIIEKMKQTREYHVSLCSPIMSLIFDLTEESALYLASHEKIPEKLWEKWLVNFKDNKPPNYKSQIELLSSGDNIQEVIDNTFTSPPEFSLETIKEYLKHSNPWKSKPFINNHLLGDVIEIIMPIAYPEDPEPPMPEGPNFLPLKVLLLGPAFSGKKTQAKKLQELYGLKIIEVPKIIEDAKKVVQKKAEEESKKKKIPDEEPEIFVQTSLETLGEDELGRSKLIRARIRGMFGDVIRVEEDLKKNTGKKEEVKCLGFVILNYPNTIQEATDLERHMSNFIHPSELPEPEWIVKKREALILAHPSPKTSGPKKLFRSAWDLVILLDVDVQSCVTRAIDRRIDPGGNIYNLTYNPPPDNILAKCKPIEHPNAHEVKDLYEEFSKNKDTLLHWYSQFGVNQTGNLLHVKSAQNIETVTEVIKNRIAGIVKQKTTPDASPFNSQRTPSIISIDQAKVLANDWEELKEQYLQQLSCFLGYFTWHLEEYEKNLANKKQEFFQILIQNDEKSEIFNNFKDSLIYKVKYQQIFTSQEIQQLYANIEELTDSIWDVIMNRKDFFLEKLQQFVKSSALYQQIAGILHISANLMQTEITKYYRVINLIEKFNACVENKDFTPRKIPFLTISWTKWKINEIGTNVLTELYKDSLDVVIKSKEHELETRIFKNKLENIVNFAKQSIIKYQKLSQNLDSLLDVWITQAVELENQAMATNVKNI